MHISVVKRHIWFESEPGLRVIIVQETIPLGLSGDVATHPTRTEKTKLNVPLRECGFLNKTYLRRRNNKISHIRKCYSK